MNPLKVNLKLAKANYAAARARGDAAAARRYLEEIADLKGRRKGQKAVSTVPNALTYKAKRSVSDKLTKKWAKEAKKVAKAHRPEDAELDEIRWLKRELTAPDAVTRRGALEKLRRMLSDDELAAVLTTNDPSEIVRKAGPSGRGAKAQTQESVGWMVQKLGDKSLPSTERAEITDRLTRATATDPKATEALARIMTEQVR